MADLTEVIEFRIQAINEFVDQFFIKEEGSPYWKVREKVIPDDLLKFLTSKLSKVKTIKDD